MDLQYMQAVCPEGQFDLPPLKYGDIGHPYKAPRCLHAELGLEELKRSERLSREGESESETQHQQQHQIEQGEGELTQMDDK